MLLIYSAIESLTVKCLPNSYLKQCPIREVFADNKSEYVVSLYQLSRQTFD